MKYSIPLNKLEKLEKIITRYQKKGANITFNVGDEVIEDGILTVNDSINHCSKNFPIKVTCKEVFVEGIYQIEDWAFVGTIDFTSRGNIIRLADDSFAGRIPVKYYSTPKICEHCGKIRNRKDTYLIYNSKTDEFKQVGSTCLLEYTQGLDADECASIMACLDKVSNLQDYDCIDDEFIGKPYSESCYGYSRENILPLVYAYVSQYGYTKSEMGKGTACEIGAIKFGGMLDEELQERVNSLRYPTKEELAKVDAYAEDIIKDIMEQLKNGIYDINEYKRNASLTWLKNCISYRDIGLVASFVNTYLKSIAKAILNESKTNSQYQGNIGDRITIRVKSARVIYTKYTHYTYYGEATYVQELIDTDGNVYIWSSQDLVKCYLDGSVSDYIEDAGDGMHSIRHPYLNEDGTITLKGTVKEYKEYNGIKQTVLTRCKILYN